MTQAYRDALSYTGMKNTSFLYLAGFVVYSLMYLLWSGFAVYGFTGTAARLASFAFLVGVMMIFGQVTGKTTVAEILPFSAVWALTVIGLDVVLAVPYAGWGMFSNASLWVGYALVFLVPLALAAKDEEA